MNILDDTYNAATPLIQYWKGYIDMLNDRRRILELALESLELKKKQIDEDIAEINLELRGKSVAKKSASPAKKPAPAKVSPGKRTKFTKEERLRRSRRMKEYWNKKKASSK
jgi:hypothetical protein